MKHAFQNRRHGKLPVCGMPVDPPLMEHVDNPTGEKKWSREHGYFTLGTASRYYEADLLRKGEVSAGTAKSCSRTVRAFCRWLSDEKKLKSLDMDTVPVINGALPSSFRKRIADCDLAYICSVLRRRGESGLREALMLLLAVTCSLSPEQISELMPEHLLVTEDGAWLTSRWRPVT